MTNTDTNLKSESYLRHRKQRAAQILLPVWIAIILILAVAVLVVLTAGGRGPGGSVSAGADTAVIWLIIPVMFFALILGLVLFGLVYLVAKILQVLPSYTYLGQQYANLIAAQVTHWANLAVKPFIALQGFGAMVGAFFTGLFGKKK